MKHNIKKANKPQLAPTFRRSLVAVAVIGMSQPALAQDDAQTPDDELEVISVKGTRGNVISAQNIKLSAGTVVDALSAKDMGSLPDRSVLEAITRLPGVALERFAGANDPDHFGVEGGGVVVRGLTQVRSEFNGRDSFSAEPSGQGLNFEDVSPELIGSVTLYKNQTADMIEGGIAGSVSLNTRKAFDSDGRAMAFSADMTYTDLREKTAPTFSALYSDIIELDSGGRLGFLVNYSNSKIKVLSDGVQVGKYKEDAAGTGNFTANGGRITRKNDDRQREGFASSLQFENADKTLLLTGEFIRSEADSAWNEYVSETDNGNSPAAYDASFDSVGSDSYFDDGVVNTSSGNGLTQIFQTRVRDENSVVTDYSFNAKYTPNDTWKFQYDLQYIDSEKKVIDHSIMGGGAAAVSLEQNGDDLVKIAFFEGSYTGGQTSGSPFRDQSNYFYRSAMDHAQDNEGDEIATRFDAEYTFDDGIIESVSAGVRYAKRELLTRESTFNWKNLSEAWAGNGRFNYDDADLAIDTVNFDNLARGGVFSAQGGTTFLFPSVELARNLDTSSETLRSALTNANGNGPDWRPLAERGGVVEGTKFLPTEINETSETNTAFYVKADFSGDVSDMDYSGNLGFRYFKLENDTAGALTFPLLEPNKPNSRDGLFPADQIAFSDGASRELVSPGEYSKVLPSFNLRLNITDEILMRFAFSEAVSLPSLEDLRNFVSIGGTDRIVTPGPDVDGDGNPIPIGLRYDRFTGRAGNPELEPMESLNYDVTFEYYFAEAGSFTVSLFHKELENYFINGVQTRSYTNGGATQVVDVSTTLNGDEGSVSGFELSYSRFFDELPGAWSGLGTQLNYTRITENGSPNADNIIDADGNITGTEGEAGFSDLPLEGLSGHNANAAIIYEKDGWNARAAYNWRSRYLLTTEDVITKLPIFNEANGSLDASVFYDVNDNIQVGIQGTNLNDNVTQTLMQVNEAGDVRTRSFFVSDRRYSFVVKGNF